MAWASTGLAGLDDILCDIRKGDNIVWQVDSIDDYRHFVTPYVEKALADRRRIVYMRFAKHDPVVTNPAVTVYNLDPDSGFEGFSTAVHNIISREGVDVYYVFDSLSDLLSSWATDLMIGNFFMVTCPYLFELDTIAYFGILRNRHSFKTIARIRGTTQLLLDLYNLEDEYYIHPLKVWKRYSPTMFLPHLQKGEVFYPVTRSMDAARLFAHLSEKGLDQSARSLDHWDRVFLAADKLTTGAAAPEELGRTMELLCKLMIGKEKRIAELTRKNLSLADLMAIKNRLIGSGFIGGKAVGMLLAQNILLRDQTVDWSQYLEPHDSFFVGSDVFYTYIVENGWWKSLMRHKTADGYFEAAAELHEKILHGKFPDEICDQFREMIEYFGQSPIIVRSSSLLEDSFGNAFAGKYESIFLVNQGNPDERYERFEEAVRRVFASSMGEDALAYRRQRGLDRMDEQMALLVQRVSGSHRQNYFYPDAAGVAVSYNTFAWKPNLDPKAGMIRLVLGLGTRAVNRVEDDYPQIVALDDPLAQPHADMVNVKRFSQSKVDLLDLQENILKTVETNDLLNTAGDLKLDLIAVRDTEAETRSRQLGLNEQRHWIVTFRNLLSNTDFSAVMRNILQNLQRSYDYPVDVEFTVNFSSDGRFRINLVQCRPLQTKGPKANVAIPKSIKPENVIFKSTGYTMGGSISQEIKRVIYVDPRQYVNLPIRDKYNIARSIGKVNRQVTDQAAMPTILMGPGRWGTTTPSLGVPVHFAEINNIAVLVEIAYGSGNLMPELSFGTHFFQDLVEGDIFYVALFPEKKEVAFNTEYLRSCPNKLAELIAEGQVYENVMRVFEPDDRKLQIIADVVTGKVAFFSTSR